MACLCCRGGPRNTSHTVSTVSRQSQAFLTLPRSSLIDSMDHDLDDFKQRNAHHVRLQLTLTEELSRETYGLEVAKKNRENYEAQDFFAFKEILGSGATAVVFRAVFKPTGNMYAVKFIPNFKTAKLMVMRELQVLKLANECRFLIDFHSHFRVGQNLYFVTEICDGGTLEELLQPKHHLPAKLMKVYLKELSSALFFLHAMKLVHRDISMVNLLIDSTGHLRLGDYGLCRMVDDPQGEMMTDCGKPYTKAPEVYMDKPCSFPMDWWSVGILIYRFITGYYPFKTEKLTQGYHSVTKHQEKYPEWAFVDPHAKSLCQGLLIKKPRDRLAADHEESTIKNHPYFQDVNWAAKEDMVALATSLLDPSEVIVDAVPVQRLLVALGVATPRLNSTVTPYPYPAPAKSTVDSSLFGARPTTSHESTSYTISLLPKGDGHSSDTKRFKDRRRYIPFQETTV